MKKLVLLIPMAMLMLGTVGVFKCRHLLLKFYKLKTHLTTLDRSTENQ